MCKTNGVELNNIPYDSHFIMVPTRAINRSDFNKYRIKYWEGANVTTFTYRVSFSIAFDLIFFIDSLIFSLILSSPVQDPYYTGTSMQNKLQFLTNDKFNVLTVQYSKEDVCN